MAEKGIYLYGYYGQGNLGDDLLLESALMMLGRVLPEARVFIHCHDEKRVPHHAERHTPVPANGLLAAELMSRVRRFTAYFSLLRSTFRHCRALVFGGGTVFQDSASPMSLLLIAGTVSLAKRMGLKVITLGSGIGELHSRRGRWAMRAILQNADIVCLRDERSIAIAKALHPTANLRLTADLAFALPVAALSKLPRKCIALSIQPAITNRDDQPGRDARAALCTVIAWALEAGYCCDLIAFETKAEVKIIPDDDAAWGEVASSFLKQHPDRVIIRRMDGTMGTAMALLQTALLHVGMRYHGHVLAAVAGVPFVGLAHDVKVREICRVFSMPCLDNDASPHNTIVDACCATLGHLPDKAVAEALRHAAEQNVIALRDGLVGSS